MSWKSVPNMNVLITFRKYYFIFIDALLTISGCALAISQNPFKIKQTNRPES